MSGGESLRALASHTYCYLYLAWPDTATACVLKLVVLMLVQRDAIPLTAAFLNLCVNFAKVSLRLVCSKLYCLYVCGSKPTVNWLGCCWATFRFSLFHFHFFFSSSPLLSSLSFLRAQLLWRPQKGSFYSTWNLFVTQLNLMVRKLKKRANKTSCIR